MKRGLLFTTDVIIAVTIVIIAAAVLLSRFPDERQEYYIEDKGHDITNVLSHTRTTDLCTTLQPCTCPGYTDLQSICNKVTHDRNRSILGLYTEAINTSVVTREELNASVHEIFVEHQIIDENRFGFSLIVTPPQQTQPLELYNTER